MIELTSAQAVREHYRTVQMRMRQQFKPPRRVVPIVDATPNAVPVEVVPVEVVPVETPAPIPEPMPVYLFVEPPIVPGAWNRVNQVRDYVARRYSVAINDILSPRRDKRVTLVRHIGMYISKQVTTASYPEIGRRFGRRDHTTAMAAVARIERMAKANPDFEAELERMIADIRP